MLSNLVATLRADLDAIRDDIGGFVETVKEDATEFVETVKTDATQVMGMVKESRPGKLFALGAAGQLQQQQELSWEEELWDDPDLLCEDVASDAEEVPQLKKEEIDMFLSAPEDGIIPELYRELVPARATHDDFFRRLAFHRHRLTLRARQQHEQQGEDEEEETRWDDDDSTASPAKRPVVAAAADDAVVAKLLQRIDELERALKESEAKRHELEQLVHESRKKKPAVEEPVKQQEQEEEEQEEEQEQDSVAAPPPPQQQPEEEEEGLRVKTPAGSWEALSESSVVTPSPVVVPVPAPTTNKTGTAGAAPPVVSLDDNEEDDWE